MIEIVPATQAHARVISEVARPADVAELWAQARSTPLRSMQRGMKLCRAYTGMVDGEPACMFGVTPVSLIRGWGSPWMVGSESLDTMQARKALLRVAREVMADWREHYTFLLNFVDERNESAIRWLGWLGFKFAGPQPMGEDGVLFRPFYWSSINV